MNPLLATYKAEMQQELKNILHYWITHTLDETNGGFVGRIDHYGTSYPEASKGAVLNSRILWSFSAAYRLTHDETYKTMAARAFDYLVRHFIDKAHGGVFWTVDAEGQPLDTKKQIYAQAFAVYGFSEYHQATGDEEAQKEAVNLYKAIVAHSHDKLHGGFTEAFARNWQKMADIRLSDKDANEPKSMNTHLHLLEGFANLYCIWPNEGLKENIRELVRLFLTHIIDPQTHHLRLFFGDDWQVKSGTLSYGHDIEAAWLVQEAAEVIGEDALLKEVKHRSVQMAQAAAEGLDKDGGLWYEYQEKKQQPFKEKHWWPQAEAMVGFFNAWQLTGDENWLHFSRNNWRFVKEHILDKDGGEWFWGLQENGLPLSAEDKVGLWKCPYHNSRACIEIIRRISTLETLAASVAIRNKTTP